MEAWWSWGGGVWSEPTGGGGGTVQPQGQPPCSAGQEVGPSRGTWLGLEQLGPTCLWKVLPPACKQELAWAGLVPPSPPVRLTPRHSSPAPQAPPLCDPSHPLCQAPCLRLDAEQLGNEPFWVG